ncbi:MAG: MFS transporter [Rickettsiales bacterium]|nr:MFS transporter [Pseudomonadota bacterium]MDA0966201.1 MFS transporter [Pseudomonadota bacterium]MDG4543134.1 MFS transporter [Rickettsiales bacterium]MDG4545332.1 MFS transporter [Rickettsiales bacterium]MDG4547781.1 MFS transporter [Rickettsiales bacterium]
MREQISAKELVSYGSLAAPLSFAGISIYVNAPDYYATQYGMSLGTLGLALLALRFIDGIQDSIIGYLSDRNIHKRTIFMPLSLIILGISFFMLFSPITSHYLIWFILMIFISTTAFSILTINLNSIGAMWSRNSEQKTTIAAYREIFGIIGLLIAITLPSILQMQMGKVSAFFIMGLTLLMLIALTLPVFFSLSDKIILKSISPTKLNVTSLPTIPNKIKQFYIVYALSMLASSIPAVLVLFFIRDRLDLENYTGLFLLTYFAAGAIGIPLWKKLSIKKSKNIAWLYSMLLAIIVFFWATFLNQGSFWQYLIICLLSGIAFGADLVLPHSILADYTDNKKDSKHSSFYYGILAFLAKLSFALAAAISLPLLESQGFAPAKVNSEHALTVLSIIYGAIPCVIKIFSILLLRRMTNATKTDYHRSFNNVK